MKKLTTLLCLMIPIMVYGQLPPGTEIYLLDLSVNKKGVSVANPQNITNHTGYDNQPSFHPDKKILYYTSANAEGRTDLMEYNLTTKEIKAFTSTSEKEYSPTVTPDKKFISCIIQRDNGVQDLGKYPIEGGSAVILVNTLTVGYHAWIDQNNLLLFVLGDTLTLRKYDLTNNKETILAKRIGRSLHRIPNSSSMSFVHKLADNEWVIKKINTDGNMEVITSTLPGREDLTWTPDGKIMMSDGKKLFYYHPGKSAGWQEIEMPANMPAGTITRLSVNPKATLLSLVVSE